MLNINYRKLTLLFICFYTFFLFMIVVGQPVPMIGAFRTFVFETTALQYEHSIYITEKTFENARIHFPAYYEHYRYWGEWMFYPGNPKTGENINVCFYFPAYSVSCIPVSMALELLGLDQDYAFGLTNLLLLIAVLFVVFKFLKTADKTKFFLVLALGINPILYYVVWANMEVLIYALIVFSLVFFFNKAYKISAFFLTIAGSMNMTVMALGFFMIIIFFIDLHKEKGKGKSIITTAFKNLPVIGKYAASFSFIFLVFIYNYIATAGYSFLSAAAEYSTINNFSDRFFMYLFDLNFGLLPWFSGIFVLYFIVIVAAIFQQKYHYFLLATGHFGVTLGFSLMSHINCDMSGISRYNGFIAPVMLFVTVIFLFEETKGFRISRICFLNKLIIKSKLMTPLVMILSFVFTILMLFLCGFEASRNFDYITMGRLSQFILNNRPELYNPLYSTFITRVDHRPDGGYDYQKPVFYTHKGEIRKILVKRNEKHNLYDEVIFENDTSRSYFESRINKVSERGGKYVYLNIPSEYKIWENIFKQERNYTSRLILSEEINESLDNPLVEFPVMLKPETLYKVECDIEGYEVDSGLFADFFGGPDYDMLECEGVLKQVMNSTQYYTYFTSSDTSRAFGEILLRIFRYRVENEPFIEPLVKSVKLYELTPK